MLDYIDGNGVSYYIDMDSVQASSTTSEEGYGDWPGADYLLSPSMYVSHSNQLELSMWLK